MRYVTPTERPQWPIRTILLDWVLPFCLPTILSLAMLAIYVLAGGQG